MALNQLNSKSLKIGFVTDAITKNYAGMGRYALNVFRHLQKTEHKLISVDWRTGTTLSNLLGSTPYQHLRCKNPWPMFKTILWHMTLLLSLERKTTEMDLLFNPSQFLHLTGHLQIPYVYVVHDLSFFSYPECHKHGKTTLYNGLFGHTLRKASWIVCVSEYSRRELLKRYPNFEKKVTVVYEAAENHFKPIKEKVALNLIRKKYNLPNEFLLFVGTVEPRKNLDMAFLAYHKMRDEIPFPLYIAGKIGWRAGPILELYELLGIKNRVYFLGYVPDSELPGLYNLATALLFISKDEGFGLPVVEAMQCGTPAIISDSGSLPEIAGNAALTAPVNEPDAIGEAMLKICKDEELRQNLREKGIARSRKFTWYKTAAHLNELFKHSIRNQEIPNGI